MVHHYSKLTSGLCFIFNRAQKGFWTVARPNKTWHLQRGVNDPEGFFFCFKFPYCRSDVLSTAFHL